MKATEIKILVVSDDSDLQQTISEIIEKDHLNAQVSGSVDYHDIISSFNTSQYDVYLVDSRVFSGKGLRLIKTARDQGNSSALVLIDHDNSDNKSNKLETIELGASCIISREEISQYLGFAIEHSYMIAEVHRKHSVNDKYMRILSQSQPVGMLLVDESLTVKMANNFAMYMAGGKNTFQADSSVGDIIRCSRSSDCQCKNSGQDCVNDCELTSCISEVFQSGKGILYREMELDFSSSDHSSKMWARVSAKPVFIESVKHVVVTIDDLTQKHEMELLLQKAQQKARDDTKKMKDMNSQLQQIVTQTNVMVQEAFAANKAKNDFMANISHELRTPLNGIQGFCQLLLEEELNETQKDYAQTIHGCTKDLIRVLNNILEFTRLEKNSISMMRSWFNIDEITEDITVMYKDTALSKGLNFSINKTPSCPIEIKSDQSKLKQSLFNIVENAIKYTSSGDVVINISGVNNDGIESVCFDIIDSGIGMSEEAKEKIFDSFCQADTSATRKFDGLGLGLSVAKRYITLLGGQIQLESSENQGSKFSVIIPIDKQIKKVKGDDRGLDARKTEGILVAESEPHHADIISRYLSQMKVPFEVTLDGDKAIEKIAYNKYDFAIIDLTLTQLRDDSIIDMVKDASASFPIVALCDSKDKYNVDLSKRLGCKNILTRPVDKTKLDAITIQYCNIPEDVVEANLNTDAHDFFSQPSDDFSLEVVSNEVDFSDSGQSQEQQLIHSTIADQEDMYEVIKCFLDILPDYIEKLKMAVDNGNCSDIVRVTFDLRDSAGAAGFPELHNITSDLEKAAKDNDQEKVRLLFQRLTNISNRLALTGS